MSTSGKIVGFRVAMKNLTGALEEATAALRRLGEVIRRSRASESLEARRYRYGGMTEDLRRWPDQWQSFYCAAFLHEDCPTDLHRLGCTCRCHGVTARYGG